VYVVLEGYNYTLHIRNWEEAANSRVWWWWRHSRLTVLFALHVVCSSLYPKSTRCKTIVVREVVVIICPSLFHI